MEQNNSFTQNVKNILRNIYHSLPEKLIESRFIFLLKEGILWLFPNEQIQFEDINFSIPEKIPDEVLSSEEIASRIINNMRENSLTVLVSHDNYIKQTGGVQNSVRDQEIALREIGLDVLHVFPFLYHPTIRSEGEKYFVGVNLNGEHVGFTSNISLIQALDHISKSNEIKKLIIHHTMGFSLDFIEEISKKVVVREDIIFWLHDNFTICPSYTLLRNNIEYCGAPDEKSNACLICIYGSKRKWQNKNFQKFFSSVKPVFVAPSEFTANFWRSKSNYEIKPIIIKPHISLDYDNVEIHPIARSLPIKIAFLGFPVYHKGWELFLALVNEFKDDKRFEFYHFGGVPANRHLPIKYIHVAVNKDNRNEMTTKLVENQIDVCFLGSVMPESFSFTLYESMSAGCFIMTHKDSGNIQKEVLEKKLGTVLDDYNDFKKYLESGQIITDIENHFQGSRIVTPIILEKSFE